MTPTMNKKLPAIVLSLLALGAIAGVFGQKAPTGGRGSSPPAIGGGVHAVAPGPAAELSPDTLRILESLNTVLNEEVTERRMLAEEVAQLRDELAELQVRFGPAPAAEGAAQTGEQPQSFDRSELAERRMRERDERLVAAGFDEEKIARLRKREGDATMQQLYLRDKAIREGWYNTPRYSAAVAALPPTMQVVREELSDDDFERYLYAGGRPNRVTVQNVIDTSPAQRAGLRPGDTLISYDGRRIFSNNDLIAASSEGTVGGTAIIEIERNGARSQVYIRRGPLGIQTGLEHVDPDAP